MADAGKDATEVGLRNTEKEDTTEVGLRNALLTIQMEEERKATKLLNYIKDLKNQIIDIKSKKIYGRKEAEFVQNRPLPSDLPVAVQKNNLNTQILELNNTKVYHTLYRETMQKAAFNVQTQTAVHEELGNLDVELDESTPEIQEIMKHYTTSTHSSKELLSLIDEKEKLDKEILETRMKNYQMLQQIKHKWRLAEEKDNVIEEEDSEELKEFKRKIEGRETKLNMVAHMLTGMVTMSGSMWATDNYYLQLMLYCDMVLDNATEEINVAMENLNIAREQRRIPEPKTKKLKQKEIPSMSSVTKIRYRI